MIAQATPNSLILITSLITAFSSIVTAAISGYFAYITAKASKSAPKDSHSNGTKSESTNKASREPAHQTTIETANMQSEARGENQLTDSSGTVQKKSRKLLTVFFTSLLVAVASTGFLAVSGRSAARQIDARIQHLEEQDKLVSLMTNQVEELNTRIQILSQLDPRELKGRLDKLQAAVDVVELNPAKPIVELQQGINAVRMAVPPIGAIVAWHKNPASQEKQEGPAIAARPPDGWMECNGDFLPEDSPLRQTGATRVPNLNASPNKLYEGGWFLRGGMTSGFLQADAFQGHGHNAYVFSDSTVASGAPGPDVPPRVLKDVAPNRGPIKDWVKEPSEAPSFGPPRTALETRPISMSVVWIIRVK